FPQEVPQLVKLRDGWSQGCIRWKKVRLNGRLIRVAHDDETNVSASQISGEFQKLILQLVSPGITLTLDADVRVHKASEEQRVVPTYVDLIRVSKQRVVDLIVESNEQGSEAHSIVKPPIGLLREASISVQDLGNKIGSRREISLLIKWPYFGKWNDGLDEWKYNNR